jgi:hypothetical protein
MEFSRKERFKNILAYGLSYLLWAVSLPVAGWVVLDIRDTILTMLAVINAKQFESGTREAFYANLSLRAADTTSWLFVGVVLVVIIVVIENIYRAGMFVERLWSRFFLVLAVCLGLLGLTNLVNDLLRLTVGAFTWRGLFGPAVYGVLAVFFFWVSSSHRLPANPKPDSLIRY